jgi:hypothetical protein
MATLEESNMRTHRSHKKHHPWSALAGRRRERWNPEPSTESIGVSDPIVLEHQDKPRQPGDIFFHRGEFLVCLTCEEGGSCTITARPATPEQEAAFWSAFYAEIGEGMM